MTDSPITIREAAIDPKWHVGRTAIGLFLRIEHPRHGNVDCILLGNSAKEMADALLKTERGDA